MLYKTTVKLIPAIAIGNKTNLGPGAVSGMTIGIAPNTATENQMIRAVPIDLASRPESMPPRMPPRLPTPISRPVSTGRTCTTRTRNRISSAPEIEPNRFAVPVQAAILRSTGCPKTNLSPANSSLRSPAKPPGTPGAGVAEAASADADASPAEARAP